jgi:hypothetical protein
LECGGKRSATPLSAASRPEEKRRRRCALPAQSKTWRLVLASVCFLLSAFCFRAWGQYSIDWFKIAGGGGTSTGGVYSVSGTIGQPDAGTLSGGSYTLDGGFWGIVSVVQSPGAPLLSIERIGDAVRVFWPKPSAGFVLDQSLTVTGTWSQVPFPYTTNATDLSITVPSPVGNKFYRLRFP